MRRVCEKIILNKSSDKKNQSGKQIKISKISIKKCSYQKVGKKIKSAENRVGKKRW